ncbi:hypothetical protein FIBSPDRAFT_880215, partial [Athelia psychrophila]
MSSSQPLQVWTAATTTSISFQHRRFFGWIRSLFTSLLASISMLTILCQPHILATASQLVYVSHLKDV